MRALVPYLPFALAVLAAPAAAFVSIPPEDSVHDHVTRAAGETVGMGGTGLEALEGAVRHPDTTETRIDQENGIAVARAGEDYEPQHHCDRMPFSTDDEAFAAAVAYVWQQRTLALQFARAGAFEHAMRSTGNAVHALQDCHSHSDIVDRDAATQRKFQAALALGEPSEIELRITGFQVSTSAEASNWPPGDWYPHGSFSKDDTNATPDAAARVADGRTKFVAARTLAVETTASYLASFLDNLTTPQRAGFLAVEPEKESQGLPSVSVAAFVVLFAAAAAWSSRRPS